MSKVLIKRTRGLQTIAQVVSHAKYVGFRSSETKEKGFFGRDSDKVDYKEFVQRIESNKALKHSSSIKVQKLVFSLKQVDYDAYKRSGKDYKDLIRETLSKYERRYGVKLDWIANVHEKEGHPHAHVIIKGVSDEKGADGRYKRIYFTKEDFKEMKGDFDKEFEKDAVYHMEEKFDMKTILKDVAKGFENVLGTLAHEADREHLKAEMKRSKNSTLHRDGQDQNKRNEKDRDR
jgi:hypothetical protein